MAKKNFKKAYIVIPEWCDEQNPATYKLQDSRNAIYEETASKARYEQYRHMESDTIEDMMKYRVLRWKEKDLFPPVLHESLKLLTKEQISIMKHTYGVETDYPGGRNYYHCEADNKDFKKLILNSMAKRNYSNDKMLREGSTYFYLTDFGIEVIMSTREILRENLK